MNRQFPPLPRTLDFFSTLVIHFGNPASGFGWIVASFSAGLLWLSISDPEGVTSPVLLKAAIILSGLLAAAALVKGHLDSARAIRILKKGAVAQGTVVEVHNVTQKYRRIGAKIAGQPEYTPGGGEIKGEAGPAAALGDELKYVVQFKARDGRTYQAEAKADYNPGLPQRAKRQGYGPITSQTSSLAVRLLKYAQKGGFNRKMGEETAVLYLPNNPERALVFDALPSAPEIGPNGYFKPAPGSKAYVFLPPVAAILLITGLFYFHPEAINVDPAIFEGTRLANTKSPADHFDQATMSLVKGKEAKAKNQFQKTIDILEARPAETLNIQDREMLYQSYAFVNMYETDRERKYLNMKNALRHLESMQRANPSDPSLLEEVAGAHYTFSEYALLAQHFEEAEQAARKAMDLAPGQAIFLSHLPTALLLQGKFEAAEALYLQWKGQVVVDEVKQEQRLLKDLFAASLQQLEEAGITHPDVEKARALLER